MAYDSSKRRSSGNAGSNDGERKTVFTNSNFSFFDSKYSCLGGNFANGNFLLSLAPINADMIGKVPKKGDKVYDYDSKTNIMVGSSFAMALLEMVDAIQIEGVKRVEHKIDTHNGYRSVQLISPGSVKLGGQLSEKYILRVETKRDEDKSTIFHELQEENLNVYMGSVNDATDPMVIHSGLKFLAELAKAAINAEIGGAIHAGRMTAGSGYSAPRPARTNNNVQEEDSNSESSSDSVDEEAQASPAAKSLAESFEE